MDQSGASKLIESLFESWAPHLAQYAFQLTGSRESAEDLVQEALMALYCRLREGTQIEHPRAWTAAVVRNLARVSARNNRRRGEVLTSPEDLDSRAGRQAPSDGPGVNEVAGYMTVLTKREAEVLLLRIEARRYKEIAVRLGISPKTVASLLARGLRKLQSAVTAKAAGKPPVDRKEGRVFKTLQ